MKIFPTLILIAGILMSTATLAQDIPEPGGDAEFARLAMVDPDEYAWQLFFYMSRPALPGQAGVADPSLKFGDAPDKPLVWETWALESGADHSEVYEPDGSRPVSWSELKRDQRNLVLDENLERKAVLSTSNLMRPRFDSGSPLAQEVRTNKAMFEFIVDNGMFNIDGLELLWKRARDDDNRSLINFPAASKEIKAEWRPIKEADKPRYLWREIDAGGGNKIALGLVALHIITKDLPKWVWIDFGHVDCETAQGACDNEWLQQTLGPSTPVQEQALTAPQDTTTRGGGAKSGKDGVRKEAIGTVWQNYILRGTQTEFTTAYGSSTILSNPVIENQFQQSSCMTCHARATIGAPIVVNSKKSDTANMLSPGDPELGIPNQTLFGAGPGLRQELVQYLQTDFIWSAPFRSSRQK